jgi:hypothetical protein
MHRGSSCGKLKALSESQLHSLWSIQTLWIRNWDAQI